MSGDLVNVLLAKAALEEAKETYKNAIVTLNKRKIDILKINRRRQTQLVAQRYWRKSVYQTEILETGHELQKRLHQYLAQD